MLSWFRNAKVGTKILTGFAIALVLMLFIGGLSILRLNQISSSLSNLVNNLAVDRQLSNDMVAQILLARFYGTKRINSHDPAMLTRFQEELGKLKDLLTQADTEITKEERVAMLQSIHTMVADHETPFNQVTAAIDRRLATQADTLDVQGPLAEENLRTLRSTAYEAGDYEIASAAGDAQAAIIFMRLDAYKYLSTGSDDLIAKFDERNTEAQASLQQLDGLVQDEGQRQLLDEANAAVTAYAEGFHTLQADFATQTQFQTEKLDVLGPAVRTTASQMSESVAADF